MFSYPGCCESRCKGVLMTVVRGRPPVHRRRATRGAVSVRCLGSRATAGVRTYPGVVASCGRNAKAFPPSASRVGRWPAIMPARLKAKRGMMIFQALMHMSFRWSISTYPRCHGWQSPCGRRLSAVESLVGRPPWCQPACERELEGCQSLVTESFS